MPAHVTGAPSSCTICRCAPAWEKTRSMRAEVSAATHVVLRVQARGAFARGERHAPLGSVRPGLVRTVEDGRGASLGLARGRDAQPRSPRTPMSYPW